MNTVQRLRQSWRGWLSGDDSQAGPWWVKLAWAGVFGVFCAIGFTILNAALNAGDGNARLSHWPAWFRINLIISLSITLSVSVAFTTAAAIVGKKRLRAWRRSHRSVYFAVVPVIGTAIGWPLGLYLAFGVDMHSYLSFERPGAVVASLVFGTLISALFIKFFSIKAQQIQAENQAAEARLRLLQAQIEPHFLFNTLANVVSLMDADTPRAKAMLESFVDYLRASLTGFGQGTHTLGDEIDLVSAYLRIVKMRMEDRLHYRIDVPADLRARALPPLTLQPLVENAIVHGLEPQIGGGTIRIAAALEEGTLVLTVEDDGPGLGATASTPRPGGSGSGTALGNVRERLGRLYGNAAALRLDAVAPHGVCARLAVPA